MVKKLISFMLAVLISTQFSVAALCDENDQEAQKTMLFAIDTESGADYYETTLYLYPKSIDADGTLLAGVTTDPAVAKAQAMANYNWNVSILVYAERISSCYYKITAEAYQLSVLIASFLADISYGDGNSSGTIIGVNQPPYVSGYSYYSIATAYYRYASSGSYFVTLNSATVRVCDVITPSYTESALPVWSGYTVTVS